MRRVGIVMLGYCCRKRRYTDFVSSFFHSLLTSNNLNTYSTGKNCSDSLMTLTSLLYFVRSASLSSLFFFTVRAFSLSISFFLDRY